jgi:hypothetical protein
LALNTDCRNATNGFNGNYFSWCAVTRFADQLCPDGWRVPTVQDFENLDKIMRNRSKKSGTSVIRQYLGSWGGYTSMVQRGDHCALYWSQSAGNRDNSAYYLMLFPDRSSVSLGSKGSFSTLRCIWIN